MSASLLTSMMPALLAWLMTYAIHSTLLLGAAWFASQRITMSPIARDVLWKVALVGGVITSLAQQAVASPMARSFALGSPEPVASAPPATQAPVHQASRRDERPAPITEGSAPWSGAPAGAIATPSATLPPATTTSPSPSMWSQTNWTTAAVIGWALLAAVLTLAYVARRLVLIGRLANRRAVAEGPLPAMLDALCRAAKHRAPVRLSWVNTIASPVALGSNEICLPEAALTDLEPEEQRSLLAHELAHLTRRDPIWLVLIALLERVFFFQPLNHVARASLQRNAEFLCDDFAATQTGSGLPLAHCLARVAEWMEATPLGVPVAGMAEQRSLLVTRIARLIERRSSPPQSSRLMPRLGAVVALAVVTAAAPAVRTASARVLPSDSQSRVTKQSEPNTASTTKLDDPRRTETPSSVFRDDASVRENAEAVLSILQHNRDEAVPPAHASIATADSETMQDSASMAEQDPAVVAALIERLKDSDAGVRRAAASSLGNLKSRRAVGPLMAAAGDRNREVRVAVIQALSELEDPAAVPVLLKALSDENAEVRMHALDGLGSFQEELQSGPFIPLLKDANPEIRARAIERLGEIGDASSAPAIVPLLRDANSEVRREAIDALKEIGDRSVAPSLMPLLRDGDAEVRGTTLDALSELKAPVSEADVLRLLEDTSPHVRQQALDYVQENPVLQIIPALKKLLDDPVSEVREQAVEALAAYRDPAARLALRGALASEDPKVRRRAAEALGDRK